MTVDDFLSGGGSASIIGGGVLPRTLLDRYTCESSFIGVVFDGEGQTLWHGHEHRFATPEQVSALIARDQGCVLCNAGPLQCHAHHLTPVNAPAHGETDIDKLALLCGDCHRFVHDNNLTLYKSPDIWRTRPATPEETPR